MGGQYQPLDQPVRLADTRAWGLGRVPAGVTVKIPVDSDDPSILPHIRAFAVNLTAVSPTGTGYLTAWSGAGSRPATSTLNYVKGATVPNFAVVPSTPCSDCEEWTGLPSIAVRTSADTHFIVDLVGYYDDGSLPDGLRFSPLVPTRIVDTRSGLGATKLGAGGIASVVAPESVAGYDTWALAMNVTAVRPTVTTYLTVWPNGVVKPSTSNLNVVAGAIVPNAVQTMIGPDNGFSVFNKNGSVDLVVDVVGAFNMYPPFPPGAGTAALRGPALKNMTSSAPLTALTSPLTKRF
jgi:hypothetical protein